MGTCSWLQRAARAISGTLHPALWVPVFLAVSVLRVGENGLQACWAALILGVGGLAPLGFMLFRSLVESRRRGHPFTLRELVRRDLREVYLLAGGVGALTVGLLVWLRAPSSLLASLLAILVAVLAIAGLNRVYRASFHLGILASLCTLAVLRFGPWAALTFAGLVPVGWARHYLKQHTAGQMAVGGALGTAVAAGVWLAATLALAALTRAGRM